MKSSQKINLLAIHGLLVAFLLAVAPAGSQPRATTQGLRAIVPPYFVKTPEQAREMFYPMFTAPAGRFVVQVRWQGPDIVSTPDDYDASKETGFRPPDPLTDWQMGPNKHGRRSTYQAYGDRVGFLSLTADTPSPKHAPRAASKHAAYGYRFKTPHPVFQEAEPWALMLEAKVTVPEFVPLRYGNGQGEVRFPLGTLYFVVAFKDRTNPQIRQIPMSVLIFDSRGDLNKERIFVDPSNHLTTATSRLSSNRAGKMYTSLAKTSAVLTGIPFRDERLFRFYITPENFRNIIMAMNMRGAALSTDLKDYSILHFNILQEQALADGDESEMVSTISQFGLYEVAPSFYVNDIKR